MDQDSGAYDPERIDHGDDDEDDERKSGGLDIEPLPYLEWQAWIATKEQVVCLIDCHSSMFEMIKISEVNRRRIECDLMRDRDADREEESTYFEQTMFIISQFMRHRIITSASDEIAVVFYGTRKKPEVDEASIPCVHELLPLDCPDAAAIQTVARMTVDLFEATIGQGDDADTAMKLKDGLWATGHMFSERKAKADKRILLFSNQEVPSGAAKLKEQLELRVDELHERGVNLKLLPLSSAVRPFQLDTFWRPYTAKLLDEEDYGNTEGGLGSPTEIGADGWHERINSLISSVRCRMRRKRAAYSLRWHLSNGVDISVQLFNMVSRTLKPSTIKLHKETNQPVKVETSYICQDTGAVVTSLDTKAFNMPGTTNYTPFFPTVILQADEVAAIKGVKAPGLTLLGFKPLTCLQDYHQLKHSFFVYPNERDLKGSLVAFHAIYKAMHKQKKMAICRFVGNRTSMPSLVALMVQPEVCDEYGVQLEPPGMQLIVLPFMDDIRTPETSSTLIGEALPPQANQEQVEAAKALISELLLPEFSVTQIPNPELKRHYDVLEAMALQEDFSALETADPTLPDETLEQHAGQQLRAFKEVIYGADYEKQQAEAASKSRKRKADDAPALELKEEYAKHDWNALQRSGNLTKMTISQLKVYIDYHNLKKAGNKADLISRIAEHLTGGAA